MKKYISCLLVLLALALPMLGMEADAAEIVDSGTCGSNLTWELDTRGVLTISGTGSMRDYYWSSSTAPWSEHAENIISVIIEEGVTSIGGWAFYNCSSLESVTIPDSVTTIGDGAFYSCSSLKSVTIGNGVTSIGNYAFVDCTSLESVTIPESVTEIGDDAFYGCSSLKSVTIGDSVTEIGSGAFHNCSSLKSVTIPDSVTTIYSSAFSGCSSLESVTIGNGVTSIGWRAFYSCSSLESVTIGDSVTEIGDSAFENCSSLVSVTIGDSVTEIGYDAFSGCSSLESITIPDSVTGIGGFAFYGCSSLTDVYITDITAWLNISFGGSYANPLEANALNKKLYLNGNLVTNMVIPEGVTTIAEYAFSGCSSLESVTIPDSVTEIGYAAFSGCSSLESVTIGDSVTEIGYRAFYNCSSLKSVTIPDSVNEIGQGAFCDCSSLASVTIGDSVTKIGSDAFYDCSSLESVTIPDSVTSFGDAAFSGCSSLTDIYYGGTEEQWDALDCWTEADWIHYGCTTAEGHWTSKGMTMVCSCGYTQGSIGNPENQLHLAGYVGQTFTVEVTSGSNYDYELAGENSDYVSVSLSGISTMVTGSGTVYGKEYTLTFSQPGHYELAFEQDWTGNTFCFSADIYAKDNSFEDVAEDAYYFGPVLWAVNEGITNGMSENSFAPEATCTRGQIVTFLWRSCGSPEPESSSNPFWDVSSSDYFYKAVLWAVENGITSGMGDGSFAPNAPCTRGQVATFLWRACGQPAPGGTNIFTDIAPGAYYYDAVLWAVENGITNGMGDGTFAPDSPCTRGQIVTFLYRAMA